jgi:integrase
MGVKVREKEKGSKVFWLFIDYNRQRKAKRVGDKKAAELAAVKIRAKLAEGDTSVFRHAPATVPTFAEYAERWLTDVAALRCQPSSLEQYRLRLRTRVLPHLGRLPLTAITKERIKALVGFEFRAGSRISEDRGISSATVQAFMQTLVAVLNSAVDDGLINSNPAARWGRVVEVNKTQAEEIEVFTAEELTTCLGVTEREYPEHYPFLLLLARTGLRLGEAVALQWADVDFNQRVVLVRRSIRRGVMTPPKNGKARRVDMSRQLAATLAGWKSLQEANAVVAGRELEAWVFGRPEGRVDRVDSFRRSLWAPLLRQAGLRYRKPHTLRHSYASLLIQAGEPLTYVQQQLGHHSPAFTLAVYGHLIPRGSRRAVDALDDATGRNLYATDSTTVGAVSV